MSVDVQDDLAIFGAEHLDGLSAGCLVASAVTLLGALVVVRYLPSHPRKQAEDDGPVLTEASADI